MKTLKMKALRASELLKQGAEGNYLRILHTAYRALQLFEDPAPWVLGYKSKDLRLEPKVLRLLELAGSLSDTVYPDAAHHFAANQFSSLIKKYPFDVKTLKPAAEEAAWRKFLATEQKCSAINLNARAAGSLSRGTGVLDYHLQRMRDFISYVLGNECRVDMFGDLCEFGPGANVGVSGDDTNRKKKLLSKWSCTPSALDYARYVLKDHIQVGELLVNPNDVVLDDYSELFDREFRKRLELVHYNKVTFVPKTTMVSRSIAVEPLLNSYLQKGVDQLMRRRLLQRAGLDLSDQRPNCEMARLGSFDFVGGFCTIDLSSASDSIATEVVRELLPPDWFYLLDRIRAKSYIYKGQERSYSKFCSMGNGFCFPLQTLIFAAACVACDAGSVNADFRVYGDDIIVRDHCFESVVALLAQLGFTTNKNKTFGPGSPFRESCGEDYFGGVDVRPVILDYRLDSLQSVFKFHNSFYRSAICLHFGYEIMQLLRDSVPEGIRLVAPDYSDTADGAFRVELRSDLLLQSRFTAWNRDIQCLEWIQLEFRSVPDTAKHGATEREVAICYLYGALSGSSSTATFTYRRKTKMKLSRKGYSGTSTWVPFPPIRR